MITDLKIWDDEQPMATYPPLEKPIDKRLFWCDPPPSGRDLFHYFDPINQMTEWEYVQQLMDAGTTYSYWYDIPVSVLAESLGIV